MYTTDLISALNYLKGVSSFKYQKVTRHMLRTSPILSPPPPCKQALNLLLFLPFSLPSPSSLLELPNNSKVLKPLDKIPPPPPPLNNKRKTPIHFSSYEQVLIDFSLQTVFEQSSYTRGLLFYPFSFSETSQQIFVVF